MPSGVYKYIGHIPWNKGKKLSYNPHPKQKGIIPWNKGKKGLLPYMDISGLKPGWNKGKKFGKNPKHSAKMKIIAREKGYGKWMRGKHPSKETRRKMSLAGGGDGISIKLNPYPTEFNPELKLKIRTRDNFTCCLCGRTEREELEELNRVLCINHIDFNKNDCRKENLNTLCVRCNVKINRKRDYWTNYFNNII